MTRFWDAVMGFIDIFVYFCHVIAQRAGFDRDYAPWPVSRCML